MKLSMAKRKKPLQSLVLVHPSSLDSYEWSEWSVGPAHADDLDENMHLVAVENPGPVWALFDSVIAGEGAWSFGEALSNERPDWPRLALLLQSLRSKATGSDGEGEE